VIYFYTPVILTVPKKYRTTDNVYYVNLFYHFLCRPYIVGTNDGTAAHHGKGIPIAHAAGFLYTICRNDSLPRIVRRAAGIDPLPPAR